MNNLEKDVSFNKNEDQIKLMISNLNLKLDEIYLGGGKEKINKQKLKGKLGARERIELLLDKDSPNIEIGALAGYKMYQEAWWLSSWWSCRGNGLCPPKIMYSCSK